MSIDDFDTNVFKLGKLCNHNHDYQGSGQSLRYVKGARECAACLKRNRERYKESSLGKENQAKYYRSKHPEPASKLSYAEIQFLYAGQDYFLGILCRNKHDHENTGKSLRRVSKPENCIECERQRRLRHSKSEKAKVRNKAYNQSEKVKQAKKVYRQSEVGKQTQAKYRNSEQGKIAQKKYYKANREKIIQRVAEWTKNNGDRIKQRCVRWRQSESGKLKETLHAHKRRVAKRANGHTVRLTEQELKTIYKAFDHRCAYCDSTKRLSIDHYIPLDKGGLHSVENIILACLSCNSSKRNKDAESWYKSRSYFAQSKWEKIQRYIKKEVVVVQLNLF